MIANENKMGCLANSINSPGTNMGINAGIGTRYGLVDVDASLSSSIYRNSTIVTPLSQSTLMLVKY